MTTETVPTWTLTILVISGASGCLAAALAAWLWQQIKAENSASIKKLKRALYNEDGTPIYITRGECMAGQLSCRTQLCSKVDALDLRIEKRLDRMDASRDKTRADINEKFETLIKFMGRVEEHLGRKELT